jgi:O-antigen/teichoic acid export membrane protein
LSSKKRLLKNAATLFAGTAVSILLGILTLACNARGLGAELFGVFAIFQAFNALLTRLLTFDTWQPVIQLGAQAIHDQKHEQLRDILRLGFFFDLVSAVLAGIVALVTIVFVLPIVGVEQQYAGLMMISSISLFFTISGTPNGIFRLFNRFDLPAKLQASGAVVTFLVALSLFLSRATLPVYVYSHTAVLIGWSMLTVMLAFMVMREHCPIGGLWDTSVPSKKLRSEFWGYAWSTSFMSTINAIRQNADMFLLAALSGPAASGLYKVCVQVASPITRIGDPLQQALFPEVAKAGAKKDLDLLKRMITEITWFGGALVLCVVIGAVLFGNVVLSLIGSQEYSSDATPLIFICFANSIAIAGFYLRPTIVSLVGTRYLLITYIVSFAAFLPTAYFGIKTLGVAGAGLSQIAFNGVWFAMNFYALHRLLQPKWHEYKSALNRLLRGGRKRLRIDRLYRRNQLVRRGFRVAVEIKSLESHIWCGYYDLAIGSPDGKKIVYHELKKGDSEVEFGVYDLVTKSRQCLGKTAAWSYQLGTRLQFLSDDEVVYYTLDGEKPVTRIQSVATGATTNIVENGAYYSVSNRGDRFTMLNYDTIRRHRKGYGFPCSAMEGTPLFTVLERTVDSNGLGQKVLFSMGPEQCAQLLEQQTGDIFDQNDVHVNAPTFDATGERIAFVIVANGTKRVTKFFVLNIEDQQFQSCPLVLASHFTWISETRLSVFGVDKEGEKGYWEWDLVENEIRLMRGDWLRVDGHQTLHPSNRNLWCSDTYPDSFGYHQLYLIDGHRRIEAGLFYGPLGMAFDKCDLHPRWLPNGYSLVVDTACDQRRKIVVLDCSEALRLGS